MLHIYARRADRFCLREISNPAIEQAIAPALWYDLLSPTPEEVSDVEAALHVTLPTREEMEDIELSARLYQEDGASFMTMTALTNLDGDEPVFVNMTAAWCITCKVNEKVALAIDSTHALFTKHNVKYLKGDWTNQNPEITNFLEEYGRSGVPIYVYYGPRDAENGARPEPVVLPQILTPSIIESTLKP